MPDQDDQVNAELRLTPRRDGPTPDCLAGKLADRQAMKLAVEHFEGEGHEVEDVSDQADFDLRCSKKGEILRVEVKGTTAKGPSVVLTHKELALWREGGDDTAMLLVHSVKIARSEDQIEVSGGVAKLVIASR